MKNVLLPLAILVAIIILVIICAFKIHNKADKKAKQQVDEYKPNIQPKQEQQQATYEIKQKYLSHTEQSFYNAIKTILNDKYLIFPQVPLSQIIIKNSNGRYQNELYRVIDFCIFDKDFHPLLCIEINDETHRQQDRYIRDKKVQDIINSSGLHLITFWTEYGVNTDYIRRKIGCYIKL